jgi:hypothetical protein
VPGADGTTGATVAKPGALTCGAGTAAAAAPANRASTAAITASSVNPLSRQRWIIAARSEAG